MSQRYYITTPIYYVNDLPHIGHTYTTVAADALARFRRLIGHDVYFLTGTDEHGQKMERSAEARNITPQQLADEVVENYKAIWPALEISHDDFIRTTESRHKQGVYAMFDKIRKINPDAIYKGTYHGLYCTGCESFYAPNQVKDGLCPDQGHPVEEVEEESWFFKLSAYQDRLLEWYENNPGFVQPATRLNEVRGFVAEGLRDLSISRAKEKVAWGIPFPGDDAQVVYVWFDALTNYISALGYGSDDAGLFDRYWGKDPQREQIHLIGKDILRFHAVYWPAFLMAAEEPLPSCVYAHGWWLKDDAKMSKTKGNVARPEPLLADYGADAVRWFLLREITLGLDGSFSDEGIIDRANSDLSNNIGNLFSRVVALLGRNENGTCPAVETLVDDELGREASAAREAYRSCFENTDPRGALRALTDWADAINRYLVRHEPWRRKEREETCSRVLRTAWGELAHIALRLHPAMPSASRKFWRLLGLGDDPASRIEAGTDLLDVADWFTDGIAIPQGEAVFPRLDKKKLLADVAGDSSEKKQKDKPKKKPAKKAKPEADEQITVDDFFRVDLRTAKILVAEQHPDADRLLRLEIDVGHEKRQLVAGIAKDYKPEELVGRTIVVVANLKPAKLRGLESNGMLLAATDSDGKAKLLMVDGDIPPGTRAS